MSEILNPDVVCEDCNTKWTKDNEWVMDSFRCDAQQEFCLNCCGCEDHNDVPFYEER